VRNLPLQAGVQVEIIILIRPPVTLAHNPYLLHDTPITYHDPTDPIAETDCY